MVPGSGTGVAKIVPTRRRTDVDVEPADFFAVEQDVAGSTELGLGLDQPVDDPQQRALAASGPGR